MNVRLDHIGRTARLGAIFCLAFLTVLFVRIALTLASYQRLSMLLSRVPVAATKRDMHRTVRCVGRAAQFIPHASCLTQAVSARFLCALLGHDTIIRIGVRRNDQGTVAAHAWLVDLRGRVLMGGTLAELSGFTPLVDLSLEAKG